MNECVQRPMRATMAVWALVVPLVCSSAASAQDKKSADGKGDAEGKQKVDLKAAIGASAEVSSEGESAADASAQADTETEAGEEPAVDTPASVEEAPEAKASEETSSTDSEAEAVDSAQLAPGGVVVLPDSAYPSTPIRGIKHGSLSGGFHGMQWPYVPPTDGLLLGVSGSVWADTGYQKLDREDPNQANFTRFVTQARGVLRATPTYTAPTDLFVQAQVELVANKDQSEGTEADTDDLWARIGKWDLFDVQFGRFEAWEVYHLGMGLDLNTVERDGAFADRIPNVYMASFMYYRPNGVGNVAAHFYPTDYLRFEVLGQAGNEAALNTVGVRPAAIFDMGWVKVKAAAEYRKGVSPTDGNPQEKEEKGGGGSVQFVLDPYVEFGFGGAYGLIDQIDSAGNVNVTGSVTTWTYGGFANARVIGDLMVGVGWHFTWSEDIQIDPTTGQVGEFSHTQMFGAIQYPLLDRFYLKAVVSQASSTAAPSSTMNPPYDNTMLGGRLRASIYF